MKTAVAFKIALAIAVVVGIALTLFFALLTALHCSDGDGGSPYVAGDSDQEAFCSATGDSLGLLIVALIGVLPNDNCGDAEQAAYDEWLYEDKARGPLPYECETY